MLFPQSNKHRQVYDLSGFWDFCFDPYHQGLREEWFMGLPDPTLIAVPASWNEQYASHHDYIAHAWYQFEFDLPWGWQDQRICIRFGSVNYLAQVWLNGQLLGQHEGGHLPFTFDITKNVKVNGNHLVVCVDGSLSLETIPPARLLTDNPSVDMLMSTKPNAGYDFFPYCGIHRPVLLFSLPQNFIKDVTTIAEIEGSTGIVRVNLAYEGNSDPQVRISLTGHGINLMQEGSLQDNICNMVFEVSDAALWHPDSPNLYTLLVELLDDSRVVDSYSLEVGIRTVEIRGKQLLLNGRPIQLRGFGRHEDFPVIGRGMMPSLIIKDYSLMTWAGANSFRTTHYPYSDEMMTLADRLGFLVIDETPIVGLQFEDNVSERLQLCKQYVSELIERDKNHPSIIMWSLANEPRSDKSEAAPFFEELYKHAKSIDDTRPITLVSMMDVGIEESFSFLDVVCINKYFGWYSEQGDLDAAEIVLTDFLDQLYEAFEKPIIMAEFGADAFAGHHTLPPEMFGEEYQADFIERYIKILNSKDYVIGQHVWNLCDFKTGQGIRRPTGLNLKGVFTRDRRPKLAAHTIRRLWSEQRAASTNGGSALNEIM